MYEERAHKTMPSSWEDFLDALSLNRRGFDKGTDRDGLHDELLEKLRKGMHMAIGVRHGQLLTGISKLK